MPILDIVQDTCLWKGGIKHIQYPFHIRRKCMKFLLIFMFVCVSLVGIADEDVLITYLE